MRAGTAFSAAAAIAVAAVAPLPTTATSWQVRKVGAMSMAYAGYSADSCAPINGYCGSAASKCCTGLVCEPVLDGSGKLQPLCAVPDASQVDSNACYDDEHICYFHHQCCSGRCIDEDGDTVFTCEIDDANPHNGRPFVPPSGDENKQSVHYGVVDPHVPGIVIGILVTVAIAAVGLVVRRIARENLDQWNEAVDKIPMNSWNSGLENRYSGWYFDGGELGETEQPRGVEPAESQDEFSSDEIEGPPVPPRDYGGEPDLFTNIATTPPRPHVDYK